MKHHYRRKKVVYYKRAKTNINMVRAVIDDRHLSTRALEAKTNINIIRTVIDDRHLSTRALEAFLLTPQMIVRRIFTQKLEMVCVALTWIKSM